MTTSARIVAPRTALKSLLALVVLTLAPGAWGQSSASETNIDSVRGTISGGTRYVGLGGAFVAVAEDTQGVASNPAAVAVRLPYSWHAVDYALGANVAWLPKNNVYNQPPSDPAGKSSALIGSLAAIIYYRHFGFGIAGEARRNEASRGDQAQGVGIDLAANFGTVHAVLAYGFLDGQLQVGAGPRFVGLSFGRRSEDSGPLTAGVGYEAGVIVKPTGLPYRVGWAFKSAIEATLPASGQGPAGHAYVPWEAAFGFAYQFGPRPLNPSFVAATDRVRRNVHGRDATRADYDDAERELYAEYMKRKRWYLLVSSELSLIEGGGRVGLSEQAVRSRPIFSPRLGVESEVIPHYLRLRAGGYYEPARTLESKPRLHGTGGLDVRLFRFSVFGLLSPFDYWQFSVAADVARSYLNTSFSLGFWY